VKRKIKQTLKRPMLCDKQSKWGEGRKGRKGRKKEGKEGIK
jgi:hypothetical protein